MIVTDSAKFIQRTGGIRPDKGDQGSQGSWHHVSVQRKSSEVSLGQVGQVGEVWPSAPSPIGLKVLICCNDL